MRENIKNCLFVTQCLQKLFIHFSAKFILFFFCIIRERELTMKITNQTFLNSKYQYKQKNTLIENNIVRAFHTNNEHYSSRNILALQNISFHGIFDKNFTDKDELEAQNQFNSVLPHLDRDSILIFSEDLENAANLMMQYQSYINFPLSNIYFVKNKMNTASLAVFKDKDGKYKIFKLHVLNNAVLLNGGKEEFGRNVDKEYVKTIDEPVELKNGVYIKFGFGKQEGFIKTDFYPKNSEKFFENDVQKISYFEDKKNIKKYNASILMNILQKPAQQTSVNKKTFKDVGGQDKNIKILEENVIFPVKYPKFYENFRLNKGILLSGPPRCGKTLLALALANELDINFIKLSADDLTHANVGKTEENWRNVFDSARKNQPTIIFIDEFDGIAKQRSGGDMARHQDNVVNQLLSLMSDLEKSNDMVFVIAATNRKDLIDSALLQPGRFGLLLEVEKPDLKGLKQIYEIHSKGKPLEENIDTDTLCNMMFENNFTGSDVAEIFSIAHSIALDRSGIYEKMRRGTVQNEDFNNFKLTEGDLFSAIQKIAAQKTILTNTTNA